MTPAVAGDGGGGEAVAGRKKGGLVRAWVVVGSTGQAEVVEVGKNTMRQRTGIPGRDLRMLDPALSYPSTVLGRERAIVVNLEHIRSIITSQEMFLNNSKDDPFVHKIQGILRHRQAVMMQSSTPQPQESGGDGSRKVDNNSELVSEQETMVDNIFTGEWNIADAHRLKLLPLEFVALETCLYATCTSLDDEAKRLEQEAYPALDRLTTTKSKICTFNLHQVLNIKSRLASITVRVQKVRDAIEHLLDDDKDMAEMYLTEKFEEQQLDDSYSTCSMKEELEEEDYNNSNGEEQVITRQKKNNRSVKELEMILEAYFVGIEGTLNKLYTLKEYVDGTEDYIKMMLDWKQNTILGMDVVLSTANLALTAFVVLAGVFGMNIGIELFDPAFAGETDFRWTIAGGTIGCILCFLAAIAWCKHKRIF